MPRTPARADSHAIKAQKAAEDDGLKSNDLKHYNWPWTEVRKWLVVWFPNATIPEKPTVKNDWYKFRLPEKLTKAQKDELEVERDKWMEAQEELQRQKAEQKQ